MSYHAFDYSGDVSEPAEAIEPFVGAADRPDRIEWAIRAASQFVGYAALATAVMGIAYLAIR